MSNWQPIETVPDDVYVLMFGCAVYPNIMIAGIKTTIVGDGTIWVGMKDRSAETTHPISEDSAIEATHWMPLPDPPTTA